MSIDPGLSPRMTSTQVGAVVLDQIHQMERSVGHAVQPARLVSITATSAAGVERLEPTSGHGVPQRPGIEWLVRAEGTFINERVPPGGQPMVAGTGYFIIQDSDGSIVGFGFP